ncbi:MAG: acyl-CoA/acyl-ACP dehydrogenase [Desulfurococcales archaeon]|nr:acyl-CoA/acyl-ACP dehydrogenase [Desulfurococcales archaeon]
MDFGLREEERLFKESVSEFLRKEVGEKWKAIDEQGFIPTELIHKMGEHGFFAIPIPEEHGGQGGSFLLAALAAEEIGYHDPSMSLAVFTLLNNAWPFVLYLYGSPEAKDRILDTVAKGRGFFGIASTEPRGGSDVAGIETRAEKSGGGWIVNGEKIYISGVREAMEQLDVGGWLLLARTGKPEARHRGITAFCLIGNYNGEKAKGLEYSILDTIGRHGISTGVLTLRNVKIANNMVVGSENKGFYIAMEGFNLARILVAAANVGAARWALERAVEWARGRTLFEKPIASFQGVSFPLAEVAAELESVKLLVYKAAWMADKIYTRKEPGLKPKDLSFYSASAKLKAVELSLRASEHLMKILGAASYVKETDVFRNFLGVLSYAVGAEGTQNIMRYIIAREVIGKEYTG